MKPPAKVVEMMEVSKNRQFLRRLYRLPADAPKAKRVSALNAGSRKQRVFLIHILHQIMIGAIKLQAQHRALFLASSPSKLQHLNKHFVTDEGVRRLLGQTDQEQKDVLAQVTNFHILLFNIFHDYD